MSDLQPRPSASRGSLLLLDLPPGVLQHIMLQLPRTVPDEPMPPPGDAEGNSAVTCRRAAMPVAHFAPSVLLTCKALSQALCQAMLAAPSTCVRVQRQQGVTAADYEQQFAAACGDSIHILHLAGCLPEGVATRCLALAPAHLHSLSIGAIDCVWVAQLARFPRLQRLTLDCEDATLPADAAAALGRLPLRHLCLDVSWPVDPADVGDGELPDDADIDLPSFPHLRTPAALRVHCNPDLDAYMPYLPEGGEWLGSGSLHRLTLCNVNLFNPPPAALTSLEALELGTCDHDWCSAPVLSQLSRVTRLALQWSALPGNFGCLPQLRELSLAVNDLQHLPAGVAGLSQLSALDLSFNRLTDLPPGPYLGSLRALSLANNRISRLPAALAAATALEALDVTGCSSLTDASVLAQLPNLRALHYVLELSSTARDSVEDMLAELQSLEDDLRLVAAMDAALVRRSQGVPPAVNTARRMDLFERLFEERATQQYMCGISNNVCSVQRAETAASSRVIDIWASELGGLGAGTSSWLEKAEQLRGV